MSWGPKYPATTAYFLDRFWKSAREVESGCWDWTGSINTDGYGTFRSTRSHRRRVPILAHRLAFMLANGRGVEADVLVCHSCDNRRCINPAHLFDGSHTDNMRDCAAKGRHRNLKKPDCPRCGEAYSEAPPEMQKYGVKRVCWPCRRAKDKERQAAKRLRLRSAA